MSDDPTALHLGTVQIQAGTAIINGQTVTIQQQQAKIVAQPLPSIGATTLAHNYISEQQIDPKVISKLDALEKNQGALQLIGIKSHFDAIIQEVARQSQQARSEKDSLRAAIVIEMLRAFQGGDLGVIEQVAIKLTRNSPDDTQRALEQEERDTNLT